MNVKVNRYEKTIPFLLSTVVLVCLTSCSQAPGKSLTLDARVSSSISDDYETGNYGSFEYDHVSFGYYRANGKKKDSLVSLSSFATPYGETLGGSFYNTSIIDGIQKIAVQYMTSATEGKDKPTIFFGAHEYSSCQDLNYSSTWNTVELSGLSGINYFKIESGDSNLEIKSIEITRGDSKKSERNDFRKKSMGEGEYRARPIAYEGSLAAGETQVTVPIKASIDGGHYVVTESKTYTYYTCDYVAKHRDLIEDAAMISPMDVANYYSVFQEAPANYGASSGGAYDAAIAVFGDMARRVSTYTRKDGYAKCIPYAVDSKKNLPIYHEFDIALNEDYGKSRGVGRLVAFETGLAVDSYDQGSYPVCYYTDDHYATFQEYGNLGEFLPRFAAEQNVIDVAWGEPSLVTASITGLAGEISLE